MFCLLRRNALSTRLYFIACSIVLLLAVSWLTDVHAAPLAQTDGQNLRIVDRRGGQTGDVVVEGNYAYTIVGNQLVVFDVSNPSTIAKVSGMVLDYAVLDMAMANGFLYLAGGLNGLHIVSISDPLYPVEVGLYPSAYWASAVTVRGSDVFLSDTGCTNGYTDCGSLLHVVDVSRPASPTEIGSYREATGEWLGKLVLRGNYAYLLSGNIGLIILDVSNPTSLQQLSTFGTYWWSTDIVVEGNFAYLSWWGAPPQGGWTFGGVEIIDISNPLAPQQTGLLSPNSPDPSFEAHQIVLSGDYVYLSGGGKLQIVRISDPAHPTREALLDFYSRSILKDKTRLYVATGEAGLQIFDLSAPTTPLLLGSYNDGLAYASFHRLGRQNSYLYASGDWGMQVLDLSQPTVPLLSSVAVSGELFAIDENRAYLSWSRYANKFQSEYGISIIDVTNPLSSTFVTDYTLGWTWMGGTSDPIYPKTVANHRLYTSSKVPYPGYGDSTLYIIDLTSPISPTLLGTYTPTGSTVLVNGNYAYLAGATTGITVLNVAAPTTPTLLSTYSAIGAVQLFATSNSYLLAASEDGLHILDASNPSALVEVGHVPSITQTQYLVTDGDYAYLSVPNDGLHVLDLVDPAHPTEVAFYPGIGSLQVVPGMDNKLYVAAGANGLLTLQLSGTIVGKVVDSFGKPYAGVKVTLSDGQSTETNAQGDYSFTSLTPGSYTVKVESSTYDFQPTEQTLRVPSYASNSLNFTLLPKALSAAVTSASPAHLSYTDLQGNSIDFDVPAGAVTQPTSFHVLPQASAAAPGQFFTGVRFDLQTGEVSSAGTPFTFAAALTITFHYTDSAVAPVVDKNQLLLRWWDGSQWTDATATCAAATPALHELESRVLTTTVCQSGQFALFGPTVQHFLPLVGRSQVETSEMRGRFVAQHSGKCLNVLAESQQNWGSIIQWPCVGGDNEIWTVRQHGEYAQIVAKHSQKCLNVSNVSQVEGAQVIQYSCSGGDNELWRLLPVGGNLYQIVAKHSNQCLTVQDASLEDKAQVIQRTCSGSPNQSWRFEVHN